MADVLSIICFALAGVLLLRVLRPGRPAGPQARHALVASHMRTLESKWKEL